ncbi:unnamed protein product [Schistosoma turkestanicum]|nr:unnamed protein product [Schistosoma turkestanicum]
MFVAKSHTVFFVVNLITAVIIALVIVAAGLFMLSEEANSLILRKTIKLFEKHVVPSTPHYGDGVGKLILTVTQQFSIVIFACSLGNLLICIIGLIAVWNQKSTILNIYQIILGFLLLSHLMLIIGYYFSRQTIKTYLEKFIRQYMSEYVSLTSGTPASLFTGSVMALLNCCGARDDEFYWEFSKFDPNDAYDNIVYKGIHLPVTCCRMNNMLEIINTTCPFQYTIYNSNIGIGCDKPFSEEITFHTDQMVLGSIGLLLINVIMLCIGVRAVKDFFSIRP